MNFDDIKAIVEKAKDETLIPIDKSEPLMALVTINNEGVNHGVMQMYYKIMSALYNAETERIKEKTA